MDASFDVSDPSDWLETPINELAPVETALRCQVCKDFFDTPMITTCSHTFCSLCIRRCLTNDGKCPACRASDQELRLRRNWAVEELVETFKRARGPLVQFTQDLKAVKEIKEQGLGKRKRAASGEDEMEKDLPSTSRRKTRSQSRRASVIPQTQSNQVADSEEDEDYQPDDGLTACPICGKRMKEAEVFSHLDVHDESTPNTNRKSTPSRTTPTEIPSRMRHSVKPMERLPSLSYGLLKDQALRKKLSDLGIPNGGPRQLLIKRHTEWVNLVNSNCDSSRPRSKRELLSELDVWERSQGRNILNGLGGNETNSVMRKDFDGAAWATNHGNDFQQLIAKARRKPPVKQDNDLVSKTEDTVLSPHFATSQSPPMPLPESNGAKVTDPTPTEISGPVNGVQDTDNLAAHTPPPPVERLIIDLDGGT